MSEAVSDKDKTKITSTAENSLSKSPPLSRFCDSMSKPPRTTSNDVDFNNRDSFPSHAPEWSLIIERVRRRSGERKRIQRDIFQWGARRRTWWAWTEYQRRPENTETVWEPISDFVRMNKLPWWVFVDIRVCGEAEVDIQRGFKSNFLTIWTDEVTVQTFHSKTQFSQVACLVLRFPNYAKFHFY